MNILEILIKIKTHLTSFEDFNPLIEKAGVFRLSKEVGTVTVDSTERRSFVEFHDVHFTRSACCYFSDYGVEKADALDALRQGLRTQVLSMYELDKAFDAYGDKQREQFRLMTFEDACRIRKEYNTRISGGTVPGVNLDIRAARKGDYRINIKTFKGILAKSGIDLDTDEQFTFFLRTDYSIEGTPGYVLCDRANEKPQKPNCEEWKKFCKVYGLKPVVSAHLAATHLLDAPNPMSLFSYSVNGGCSTDRFAMNFATGHIVPMDSNLDLCTHKNGWFYPYKYMPCASFYPNMDVITMQESLHFSSEKDYQFTNDAEGEWSAKCLVRLARLLYAFGVEEGAMLEVPVTAPGEEREQVYFSIPLLAAVTELDSVKSLMRKELFRRDASALDNDPLVIEIRSTYERIVSALCGQKSGEEKRFLHHVKSFAELLNIREARIARAYDVAFRTESRMDIEAFKELVHSGIRKTPLFKAMFGNDADPNHVFVPAGSSLPSKLLTEQVNLF